MNLSDLGFEPWFKEQTTSPEGDYYVARVMAVDRGSYLIRDEQKEISAKLSGKFSFELKNASDRPCVGDWVAIQYHSQETAAVIHQVFPRRTYLRRKAAGDTADIQMIGANIDTAFIVQSCHFDFNPRRLDRYLVMVAEGQVEPVILLTKTDLISPEELELKLLTIQAVTNTKVLCVSNVTGDGFAAFQDTLNTGKTYCLLGSSGVGKTTLINRLLGHEAYDTKAVSETGEGMHTTTRRHLIVLESGAMLMDTPGMRELGMMGGEDVDQGFDIMASLTSQCRFADCSHVHEPGCAVRAAVKAGELEEDRYENYIKLKKESDYNEMSHQEKRKKDRAFGRFIKSAKKRMK